MGRDLAAVRGPVRKRSGELICAVGGGGDGQARKPGAWARDSERFGFEACGLDAYGVVGAGSSA